MYIHHLKHESHKELLFYYLDSQTKEGKTKHHMTPVLRTIKTKQTTKQKTLK